MSPEKAPEPGGALVRGICRFRRAFRFGIYHSGEVSGFRLTAPRRGFQKALGAEHAFQVVRNAPFAAVDCFAERGPVSVPALTFLSQLL